MVRMVERKVRARAQQIYDERGQEDGQALKDWVQAESEVIGKTVLGQLYKKVRTVPSDSGSNDAGTETSPVPSRSHDSSSCETSA